MAKNFRSRKDREAAKPFSIRLTASEKQQLVQQAGDRPLGLFIRDRLLGGATMPRAARRASPVHERETLARILAMLGRSRLADSVGELASAAASGSLFTDPETTSLIRRACDDVRAMRLMLMQALGMKVPEDWRPLLSLSATFGQSAGDSAP